MKIYKLITDIQQKYLILIRAQIDHKRIIENE